LSAAKIGVSANGAVPSALTPGVTPEDNKIAMGIRRPTVEFSGTRARPKAERSVSAATRACVKRCAN
jgi:hypothetical protein